MTFDLNYQRRTGVTTFRSLALEICEELLKFQPLIVLWINNPASGLAASDITLILALIAAANAACASLKKMVPQ